MLHALTAVLAYVGDDSVTVGEFERLCYLRDSGKDVCHLNRALLAYLVCRSYMMLRYNEAVHGRLRIDVTEGVAVLVLVDLVGGNISVYDSAE